MRALVCIAATAALSGLAAAQPDSSFEIVDANVFFRMNDSPMSTTSALADIPSAVFTPFGSMGASQLMKSWWWFRVEGESREFNLANATNRVVNGDRAQLDFQTLGSSVSARARWSVESTFGNAGNLVQQLTITNHSSTTARVNLFNYLDTQLDGTVGNDTASLLSPNVIRVVDGTMIMDYSGIGAAAWKAGTFESTALGLTDSAVTNFDNTQLPLAPTDLQLGFQWVIEIAPGMSQSVVSTVSVIPTPGTTVLGLTGVVLAVGRRRRA